MVARLASRGYSLRNVRFGSALVARNADRAQGNANAEFMHALGDVVPDDGVESDRGDDQGEGTEGDAEATRTFAKNPENGKAVISSLRVSARPLRPLRSEC